MGTSPFQRALTGPLILAAAAAAWWQWTQLPSVPAALERFVQETFPEKVTPPVVLPDAIHSTLHQIRTAALSEAALAAALGLIALQAGKRSRRTAAEFATAELLQGTILEHSAECIVLLGENARVEFVSDRGRRAMGAVDRQDLAQESWQSWWLPQWQEMAAEALRRARRGKTVTVDLAMESRTKGLQWWEVVLATVPSEEDGGERILAVMQNTTERRRAQQELRESEERFSAFVEHSPAIMFIKGDEGRYLLSNRIYEELRHVEPGGLEGQNDRQLLGLPHAGEVEQLELDVLQSGVPRRVVEEFQLEDGSKVHWRVLRFPLQLSSGKVLLGAIGVDVTRTVTAEAELEVARDTALQSAKLKSEFLANMSHEIRTPMNGIIGMAGLLLDTRLTSRQRDFVQTISSSADALLTILNDVLDFSKIEAGMLSFEEIDFDLNSVVHGAADLLAERAANKQLELALVLHPSVPRRLRGDPGRLRQILMNLLGNALKFTNTGEVVLECHLDNSAETPPEQTRILFRIRDTGIGISGDAQKLLFKAFSQADGSTTRRYGGTGLGLAISLELVHRMRGDIGVESVPGQGSVFWFTAQFPVSQAALQENTGNHLSGCRLILADPNASARTGIALAMQAAGALVEEAPDPASFLALCAPRDKEDGARTFVLLEEGICAAVHSSKELKQLLATGAHCALVAPFNRVALTEAETTAGCSLLFTKPLRSDALMDWIAEAPTNLTTQEERFRADPPPVEAPPDGLKLLVAEDNKVNQLVIRHQLSKFGHEVILMAETGTQVVAALQQLQVDAVLMDCQMPEMDGYEATSEIRRLESSENNPWAGRKLWIIAMTANTMEGDREKCLAAGMDDYMSKPLKENELREVLKRVPPGRRSAPATPSTPPALAVEPAALAQLRELGGEQGEVLLASLAEQFIDSGQLLIADLKAAIEAGDAKLTKRIAHTLKGSAANFGAHALVAECGRVEMAVDARDLPTAAVAAAKISPEFEAVRAALLEACLRA